jgi:hypothetical protein
MINELNKILKQVHEPDEYTLIPHNLSHPSYWIWKLPNVKMKDLNKKRATELILYSNSTNTMNKINSNKFRQ